MTDIKAKEKRLEEILAQAGSIAVAFSAGVDSSYLAYTAHRVLGDRMAAVTVNAPSFPARELEESVQFCKEYGIKQVICDIDQLAVSGFRENPPDRCYHCKKAIFGIIRQTAEQNGITCIAEGSNTDDVSDYRPGLKAIDELGVISPLRMAGLSKSDIRTLSKEAGLDCWDKPSFACLATRIPYGDEITSEKLRMTELAEQRLFEHGFTQFRVRVHGDTARIELPQEDMPRILDTDIRSDVNGYFTQLGFRYISLDLGGYMTGSMNRQLK